MAEPTLNVPMTRLQGIIGDYLGYGYGTAFGERQWTDRQSLRINEWLNSALRRFYQPAANDGGPAGYTWSFLRPTATLTLPSGQSEVQLPDDFAFVEGRVVVSGSGTAFPVPVNNHPFVAEQLARYPTTTGRPWVVAIAPQKGTTTLQSTRSHLIFFPIPDQAYTVELRYSLIPEALTSANPWAYGGAVHAETLVAACRATAELLGDNEDGVQNAHFRERLATSIAIDRQLKSQTLGYNGDASDNRDLRVPQRYGYYFNGPVLFNGQTWD